MDSATQDLLRVAYFGAFIGAWAFLVTWEGGDPKWPKPARRWRHIGRNIALFLLAAIVADAILGGRMYGIEGDSGIQPAGLLTGLGLPTWALVIVGLLVADLAAYAYHRLSHRWRWLWLLHSVHHSDRHLDASTAVRAHPIELTCGVAVLIAVLTAAGVPLWIEGLRAVIVNPLTMAQHANIDYPRWVERVFGWLLVTPAMHRVHHSPDPRETDTNYGAMFSFWDRIFGSYRAPDARAGARFGLDRLEGERWQTLPGMLMTPIAARGIATL